MVVGPAGRATRPEEMISRVNLNMVVSLPHCHRPIERIQQTYDGLPSPHFILFIKQPYHANSPCIKLLQ
jgi:hypothetical protein